MPFRRLAGIDSTKPFRWNASPALNAPELALVAAVPMWEMYGELFDYVARQSTSGPDFPVWGTSEPWPVVSLLRAADRSHKFTNPLYASVLGGPATIAALIRGTGPNYDTNSAIWGFSGSATVGNWLAFHSDTGERRRFRAGGVTLQGGDFSVDRVWEFWVGRWDGSDSIRFDAFTLDGASVNSLSNTGASGTTTPGDLYLGTGGITAAITGNVAVGYVANREWTDEQIGRLIMDPFYPFRMGRRVSVAVAAAGFVGRHPALCQPLIRM